MGQEYHRKHYARLERRLRRIFGTETLRIIRAARREMAKAEPDLAKVRELLDRLGRARRPVLK